MKIKILSAILFLSAFLSCKSGYDFGIDTSPKPVVNCVFHPDSIWKIELTSTPPSLWDYQFNPIEGAKVRISTKSHPPVEMDEFIAKEPGYYTSRFEKVPSETNNPITLQVITNGDTISSESYIPPKPVFEIKLLDVIVTKSDYLTVYGLFTYTITGKIILKVNTRSTGHLWYAAKLRYRNQMVYGFPGHMHLSEPDSSAWDVIDFYTRFPGAFKTLRRTDGYCLDLSAYAPETDELVFTVMGSVANLKEEPDFMVLTITSITEEYLKYNKKIVDQYVAGQDVFSEPVSVFGNIKGGLGIFSGINSVTDTIRFH
ncbi:MAG: DUF4249 family protein [Bacteroidales bacterium]|jgi:hypothetical protein